MLKLRTVYNLAVLSLLCGSSAIYAMDAQKEKDIFPIMQLPADMARSVLSKQFAIAILEELCEKTYVKETEKGKKEDAEQKKLKILKGFYVNDLRKAIINVQLTCKGFRNLFFRNPVGLQEAILQFIPHTQLFDKEQKPYASQAIAEVLSKNFNSLKPAEINFLKTFIVYPRDLTDELGMDFWLREPEVVNEDEQTDAHRDFNKYRTLLHDKTTLLIPSVKDGHYTLGKLALSCARPGIIATHGGILALLKDKPELYKEFASIMVQRIPESEKNTLKSIFGLQGDSIQESDEKRIQRVIIELTQSCSKYDNTIDPMQQIKSHVFPVADFLQKLATCPELKEGEKNFINYVQKKQIIEIKKHLDSIENTSLVSVMAGLGSVLAIMSGYETLVDELIPYRPDGLLSCVASSLIIGCQKPCTENIKRFIIYNISLPEARGMELMLITQALLMPKKHGELLEFLLQRLGNPAAHAAWFKQYYLTDGSEAIELLSSTDLSLSNPILSQLLPIVLMHLIVKDSAEECFSLFKKTFDETNFIVAESFMSKLVSMAEQFGKQKLVELLKTFKVNKGI